MDGGIRESGLSIRIGLWLAVLCWPTSGFPQQLTWLGALPKSTASVAYGVSADGAIVVGNSLDSGGFGPGWSKGFRWTAATGMVDVGSFGGDFTYARAISADGSTIVGSSEYAGGSWTRRAYRLRNGVMTDLGTLGGPVSLGVAVSADGSVVVGSGGIQPGTNRMHAMRWTESEGMVGLGTFGGPWSGANAVTPDGSVVVGWAQIASQPAFDHVFRWENGVIQNLGVFAFGWSHATAVSADGSVLAGLGPNQGFRAWRWTAATGYHDIGAYGNNNYVNAMSADGDTIIGRMATGSESAAFRWTTLGGVEDLNESFSAILGGSILLEANGMSPDGRFIVGEGWQAGVGRRAFLLDTVPEPASAAAISIGLAVIAVRRRRSTAASFPTRGTPSGAAR